MRGIAFLSSLLVLAACGGTPTRPEDPDKGTVPELNANAIRISYVRFDQDPRTHKFSPGYRCMMSNSWREQFGGWYETGGGTAKEPFRRAFPSPFLNEYVDDTVMEKVFDKMMAEGFDSLPGIDPKTIDLKMLSKLSSDRNQNRIKAHRILSVQRGEYKKTVLFAKILSPTFQVINREQALAFVRSEIAVINSRAFGEAVKVTKGAEPFKPKRRKDK